MLQIKHFQLCATTGAKRQVLGKDPFSLICAVDCHLSDIGEPVTFTFSAPWVNAQRGHCLLSFCRSGFLDMLLARDIPS